MKKKKIFNSYKFRFIFFVTLFLLITCCSLIYISANNIKKTSVQIFSNRGVTVINQLMEKIDTEKLYKLCRSLDENNPYYEELYKIFSEARNNFECKFLYVMTPVDGKNFAYVVDGTDKNDEENFSPIGTIENIESYGEYPQLCMNNKEFTFSGLENQEDWGWMVTIYGPLVNSKGVCYGFIGCDFEVDELKEMIKNGTGNMLITAIITSIICIFLIITVIISFFKNLDNVVNAMQSVSSGAKDLTARIHVPKSSELGILSKACNNVIESLQKTVTVFTESVNLVNINSVKITEQNKHLLSLIGDTNSDVGDVHNKIEYQNTLLSSLDNDIENFHKSIELLNQKILEQKTAVKKSVDAIQNISKTITNADEQINTISTEYEVIVNDTKESGQKQNEMTYKIQYIAEQAESLSEVNTVITNIAEQTNLLAMNAAIEASHAGEAGKGFSVVAEEIRTLAENSAAQTENISELINLIESAVKEIVGTSTESEKSFTKLGQKIENLSISMNKIKDGIDEQTESANNITDMMNILTDATTSISQASDKLNKNTENVVERINSIKVTSQDISNSSNKTQKLLSDMTEFAKEENDSVQDNRNAVLSIRQLLQTYKIE